MIDIMQFRVSGRVVLSLKLISISDSYVRRRLSELCPMENFVLKILKPSANEDIILFWSFRFIQKTVVIRDLINLVFLTLYIFRTLL